MLWRIHEVHSGWLQVTTDSIVSEVTVHEEVSDAGFDIRVTDIPIVELERVSSILSSNQRRELELVFVVVQESVKDGPEHIREDGLADEISRVLNDDNTKVDELMHQECEELVVMIEIGFSEVDVDGVDDWV